jgi:CPA1 family monovalent cation:H+ antiporter
MQRYAADAETFMQGIQTHFDVLLISISAGRAELLRIHRAGLIEDEVLHELERDLDVEELGIILQRGS